MTVLEAIQSLAEYKNDILLSKVLLDIGLNETDTYDPDIHKNKVTLACADLYDTLAVHPELREGNFSIKYNAKQLKAMARKIRADLGIRTAKITGKPIW